MNVRVAGRRWWRCCVIYAILRCEKFTRIKFLSYLQGGRPLTKVQTSVWGGDTADMGTSTLPSLLLLLVGLLSVTGERPKTFTTSLVTEAGVESSFRRVETKEHPYRFCALLEKYRIRCDKCSCYRKILPPPSPFQLVEVASLSLSNKIRSCKVSAGLFNAGKVTQWRIQDDA